jgi:hypothetical protein
METGSHGEAEVVPPLPKGCQGTRADEQRSVVRQSFRSDGIQLLSDPQRDLLGALESCGAADAGEVLLANLLRQRASTTARSSSALMRGGENRLARLGGVFAVAQLMRQADLAPPA